MLFILKFTENLKYSLFYLVFSNLCINLCVKGMTNRPDLIDEALMRPGRFEVKMEIGRTNNDKKNSTLSPSLFILTYLSTSYHPGLPDEKGRFQILNIHTAKMREFNLLSGEVDVKELAAETKNYSGAELEGLVRAAQSTAMNRHIKVQRIMIYAFLIRDILS